MAGGAGGVRSQGVQVLAGRRRQARETGRQYSKSAVSDSAAARLSTTGPPVDSRAPTLEQPRGAPSREKKKKKNVRQRLDPPAGAGAAERYGRERRSPGGWQPEEQSLFPMRKSQLDSGLAGPACCSELIICGILYRATFRVAGWIHQRPEGGGFGTPQARPTANVSPH